MLFTTLARPLLGAAIGYCTNYIAVKMLFRPLKPVTVLGRRLPFTPGVIPKEQARLARTAGQVVGAQLLTPEAMEQTLLSEDTRQAVREAVDAWAQRQKQNSAEIGALLERQVGEENYQALREGIYRDVIDHGVDQIGNIDLGALVAQEVLAAVQEKVRGSLLAMMVNEELLQSFASPIAQKINEYVRANGDNLLAPAICEELDRLEHRTVGELMQYLSERGVDLPELGVSVYQAVVAEYLPGILQTMDFSGIVERQIAALSPKELETLVLSVMKKELSAVVNLGALVGFALGLLNLLW